MARSRPRAAVMFIAVAGILGLGGLTPAYATPPSVPQFSGLDSSTPGHLTGTITSPGAHVIYIRYAQDVLARVVTLGADVDTFDVPTWGYSGPQPIYAVACRAEGSDCSTEVFLPAAFVPTDIVPTATWSGDHTIGPGQDASVTVNDTGGGQLKVEWVHSDGLPDTSTLVSHTGESVVTMNDGLGSLHLLRCDDLELSKCTEFSPAVVSAAYEVRRSLAVTWAPVTPIDPGHDSTTIALDTDRHGTYDLDWHLEYQFAPVEPSGSVVGQPLGANGELTPIPIDGTNLFDGEYLFDLDLTVHDPAFGTYNTVLFGSPSSVPVIRVDHSPPPVDSVTSSNSTIYPLIGTSKWPASTTFTVVTADSGDVAAIQVRSGSTVVRSLHPTLSPGQAVATWDGRTTSGAVAPAGAYTAVVVDDLGNAAPVVGHVTVSGLRIVLKTYTRTISARKSLAAAYVGRCSTLRTPSLRKWPGSLGFYANTRCAKRTWKASAVSTGHAILLPTAERYLDIRVDTYGGAASSRPHSHAGVRYLTTSGGWVGATRLGRKLRTHAGQRVSTNGLLFSDHSFGWGVASSNRNKYDVRRFTIVLRYYVLG